MAVGSGEIGMSFRVVMGQRPTHRNESQDVTPAKAGVHVRDELDSRFRGNDVTFNGVRRLTDEESRHVLSKSCRRLHTNCGDPSSSARKNGGLLRMKCRGSGLHAWGLRRVCATPTCEFTCGWSEDAGGAGENRTPA